MASFGEHKKDWFKTFLSLPNGIPSHDTFRRVFMLIDPKEFNASIVEWSKAICKVFDNEAVAVDGKTECVVHPYKGL